MANPKVTPKQAAFVDEYLIDLNATQAAIRAGYSEKTARSAGQRLLTNVYIQNRIAAAKAARSERTEITQDRVLQEYARIGFADIRKAVQWGPDKLATETIDGTQIVSNGIVLTDSDDLDEDTAMAVSEVSHTKDGIKIKMHDKKAALDSIARHLGMFVDKVEHSGAVNLTVSKEDADL